MDTKSSKCVHLVEGGSNGPQYVNTAPMGKTSLGRVTHARKRLKTPFKNLETHGDGSGYLACDTCSGGVPKEIVPAGIAPIGNILIGNNIGVQTRAKGLSNECGRSVDPRDHQRLVVVWQPGSGIAVHNVQCGVFHLFFFTTPYWSVLLRNTQGRQPMGWYTICLWSFSPCTPLLHWNQTTFTHCWNQIWMV